MTLKTDIQSLIDEGRPRACGVALVFFIFIAVFGIYNDANLFWAHCRIAEWGLLLFISLVFVRNIWLKSFLVLCLARMILVFFQMPDALAQQAGASAFIYFYYIFLFVITYEILTRHVDRHSTNFIINGLCVVAVLQTVYVWFQHFKLDPVFQGWMDAVSYKNMDVKDLVVGTWGHTNLSGAYLAASVPLFLCKRWFYFIPFLLTGLFWGRSWGAIAACAVGVIVWALVTQKKSLKIGIALFALFASFAYGLLFEHKQFNPFRSDRMQYFKPTIELMKIRPLIGWGLGQYKNAFYAVNKTVFKSPIQKTHAHFDILEYTFEMGVLGVIPIIGFLVSTLFYFLKNITVVSASAFAGAMTLLANSCSTFIFHTPLAWIFLVYLILIRKETRSC